MAAFGYLCSLVLAATLIRAAAPKLARPGATAAGVAALGLPGPAVLARVVPVTEVATAALLVALPRVGGVAALALLLAFTIVVIRALRRGLAVGCNCFGASSADPVSWADIVRNTTLSGLAVAAVTASQPVTPTPLAAAAAAVAVGAGALLVRGSRRVSSGK